MILIQREDTVDVQGDSFAPKALKACASKIVSVFRQFDHGQFLGFATLKYIKGEGLFAELNCDVLHPNEHVVISFLGRVKQKGIWKDIEIISLGSTLHPVDDTLPCTREVVKY